MGKNRIWIIIATAFLFIGSFMFVAAMANMNWDFTGLSTVAYETNQHPITAAYTDVHISTDIADVVFVPSEDGTTKVICYEQENLKHTVSVQDGTLSVEMTDTRPWYEHIGIFVDTPKITVCLPAGEYGALTMEGSTGDVKIPDDHTFSNIDIAVSTGSVMTRADAKEHINIRATTGSICVEDVSAASLKLLVSTGRIAVADVTCVGEIAAHVSTGKTEFTDVRCENVVSEGDTGDVSLKNVVATKAFLILRTTGDVHLDGCDAARLSITTDTGDVSGSLLTNKVFIAKTDTGRVKVPASATGGTCEITTDTGDITITVS